jgi:hypothetical protein
MKLQHEIVLGLSDPEFGRPIAVIEDIGIR